jgi:hypothetical protein
MKRFLLLFGALIALLSPASAQVAGTRLSSPYFPAGYCQVTGLSSAKLISTCSGGIPQKTVLVQVCVEAQAVRYRDDGTSPTSSVGMPVPAGVCFSYSGKLSALSFIEQSVGAILNVSFYQ